MTGNVPTTRGPGGLDASRLDALAEAVGREYLPLVFDAVLESTPEVRDELESACAGSDMACVARAAHKIKSDAANFRVTALVRALESFESTAKTGNIPAVRAAAPLMLAQIDQFLDDVRRLRTRAAG